MARDLGVGIIGCGNISAAYMRLAPMFEGIRLVACADAVPDAARAREAEFGVEAKTVGALLRDERVDIVVNLTVPAAHYGVSRRILRAGKHVYSEKPYVLTLAEGRRLAEEAASRNLRIGSAPDTFLGGAHQQARAIIDRGDVGAITSGTAHVMNHGMEHWHPNPDFFYKAGGGPVLDLGPYYITNLVQLLGPVARVMALSSIPQRSRTILSEPRRGQSLDVETATTVHALLEFASGAIVTLGASWDVWQHGHANMELYGDKGTLHVPDPNFFGGEVRVTKGAEPAEAKSEDHPFGIANQDHPAGKVANYRCAGLADMAQAIITGRPHRCSGELALHVVEVMTSILKAGDTRRPIAMSTTCERPEALSAKDARMLMRKGAAA